MAAQLSATSTKATVLELDPERERKAELNDMANAAEVIGFDTGKGFLHLQRVAAIFANSSMVPETFKGNLSNCCIAINLAHRLKADELMVLQNLYIVYGRPGWSAKFKIAMFNQTGKFTPISYQFVGTKGKDDWGCRAVCANRDTGERVEGPTITIGLAKAEGWYDRKSKDNKPASKWPTMPELMLRYRAASWMIDTTAPELTMGIGTVEDQIDTGELLDAAIEETERRRNDARRGNTAFDHSPSLNDPEPETPVAAEPVKPTQAAADSKVKQAPSGKKGQAAAAATPLDNPSFAEGSDGDPLLDQGPKFD